MAAPPRFTPEEIARRGEEIYERALRQRVEPAHAGQLRRSYRPTHGLPIGRLSRGGPTMMTGTVTASREAIIQLIVRGPGGNEALP